MADVTNPGTVNVADEAFGQGLPAQVNQTNVRVPVSASPNSVDGDDSGNTRPFVVSQEIQNSSPAQTPVTMLRGDNGDGGKPVIVDQPVTVSSPGPAVSASAGGNFKPGNSNIANTTQNTVAAQVTGGTGLPANVYV